MRSAPGTARSRRRLGDPARLRSAREERAAAAEIEALGYGALWFGETPVNKEAFVHSGILLAATERIAIATGIANIYARDAAATNAARNALAEAYDDRFVLGLGVSHAPSVAAARTRLRPPGDGDARLPRRPRRRRLPRPRRHIRPPSSWPRCGGGCSSSPATAPTARIPIWSRRRTPPAHARYLGPGPVLAPEQGVVLETDPAPSAGDRRAAPGGLPDAPQLHEQLARGRLRRRGLRRRRQRPAGRRADRLGQRGRDRARVGAHHEAGADHVCIQPVIRDLDRTVSELRELAPALLPAV